jgi:hypothetical protein
VGRMRGLKSNVSLRLIRQLRSAAPLLAPVPRYVATGSCYRVPQQSHWWGHRRALHGASTLSSAAGTGGTKMGTEDLRESNEAECLTEIEHCNNVEQLASLWRNKRAGIGEAQLVLSWQVLARLAGTVAAQPRGVFRGLFLQLSRETCRLSPAMAVANLSLVLSAVADLATERLPSEAKAALQV